jgi:hypothetical protein
MGCTVDVITDSAVTPRVTVRALLMDRFLAIHLAVDGDRGYTLTHIPTGRAVFKELGDFEEAKRRLGLIRDLDWGFAAQEDPRCGAAEEALQELADSGAFDLPRFSLRRFIRSLWTGDGSPPFEV